jgi:CrcB protein
MSGLSWEFPMLNLVLVFLGSGLGAIARYKLGGMVLHHTADWRFPLGTFLVNVSGCLIAGILAGAIERQGLFSADTRLFLFTGILGGFTTFSAFSLEVVALAERGALMAAVAYVIASVILSVGAVVAGMAVIRGIFA